MTRRAFARLIASGFGSGYAPKAPGTFGSLAALVLGVGLMQLSPWVLAVAAVLATAGGLWAIGAAEVTGDPGWVVIDEFAGQWIAMLALPFAGGAMLEMPVFGLAGLLAAFLLFRLLDIVKPGPIGWADRQHGAFGIMADDVIAGAIAAAILALALRLAPGVLTP